MSTIKRQAIERGVTDSLSSKDGTKWAKLLNQCLEDFRVNEYPVSYKDAIFQNFERYPDDIYDAYSFLKVHAAIHLGRVAIFSVPVSSEPKSDKDINGNNEILRKLSNPYHAEFWGGTQDEDGFLEWDKPLHGAVSLKSENAIVCCVIPPLRVPLEVGYCSSEKMFFYIHSSLDGYGIARWAYGSEKIIVMTLSFLGTESPEFENLRMNIGENLSEFMHDESRNPFLEWNKHKSKRKIIDRNFRAPKPSDMQLTLFN